jgi:hypothetical protein
MLTNAHGRSILEVLFDSHLGDKRNLRLNILLPVTLLMLVGIPAYAYGDPSGGALFQILMPTLAAIWAMWMIFANHVRKSVRILLRKLRGSEPAEPNVE